MKTKLYALALAALLVPAASAQDCEKAKSSSCQASATLASADGGCSAEAKKSCESAGTLASAEGECSAEAKKSCESAGTLASADGECSAEAKKSCESAGTLASADGECSAEAKKSCESAGTLASSEKTCSSAQVAQVPVTLDTQLASLISTGRVASIVVDGKTFCGDEAAAKCQQLIRASVATKIKQHCEASAACEKTLASNVDKACAESICAGSELASLVKAGSVDKIVVGDKVLCGDEAALVVTKMASCPEFQAECQKRQAKLAGATEACEGSKQECSKSASVQLASADGAECSSKASATAKISTCAQLVALVQPSRVAGVVIDGKAYLGDKAAKALSCMVRTDVSEQIASVCEESRNCEKTLAANVDKALSGEVCVISQMSALVSAGKVSIIVDDESVSGDAALATLAKIGECPKFQSECRERAGVADPAPAVKLASFEPVSVDLQLAALVTESRVAGLVVDGKAYVGAEASDVLNRLIRARVGTEIKANCEASRACEKTLASNVDKLMAQKVCAGTELATLIESGEIDGLLVGDKVLTGCEAKAAVQGILSCSEFQKECRELATAKSACGTTASL